MFPSKLCGVWLAVTSIDPRYLGSELVVDYNAIRFSRVKRYAFLTTKETMYGSVYLGESGMARMAWSPRVTTTFDAGVLPRITVPTVRKQCKRSAVEFHVDDFGTYLAVSAGLDKLTFRKSLVSEAPQDTIVKLFLTQVVFDVLIRKMHES